MARLFCISAGSIYPAIALRGNFSLKNDDRLPIRHWLSWQFLVSRRRIVDKSSHDCCRLLHVVCLNAIEHILVGMVCTRVIFDLILNKLEPRQANSVKR